MKILLVDLYSNSVESRKWFSNVKSTIEKVISECSRVSPDTFSLSICDLQTVSDYVYDPNLGYYSKESLTKFNMTDIIVISGECSNLPFQVWVRPIRILFNMAKRTNKHMFCIGMGF